MYAIGIVIALIIGVVNYDNAIMFVPALLLAGFISGLWAAELQDRYIARRFVRT